MGKILLFVVAFLILTFLYNVNGHKILGIFPSTSRSHYIVGSALMRGLAAKGHEVTVITAFPSKEHMDIYEEIPVTEVLEHFKDMHDIFQHVGDKYVFQLYMETFRTAQTISKKVLEHSNVQKLLKNSNRTFDLVICEVFAVDALYGFSQHFNAPIIGFSPMETSIISSALSGSPLPPSFVPNILHGTVNLMNFLGRVQNLAAYTIQNLGYYFDFLPHESKIYKKYFPHARVSLSDIMKNFSLILFNQHFSINNFRPHFQNMIDVGGLHIPRRNMTKLLPTDVSEFLDGATNGAIYFSLGTILNSHSIGNQRLNVILRTFKSLEYKIIWMCDNASFSTDMDNVLIRKWLPQNDILAHPNVKLFISHGGLLSITEAVYHGKPILGIPMLFDQFLNIERAVAKGYALELSLSELSEWKLRVTINELLKNPKYTRAAIQISNYYKDQPMEPLDTAIYWVEYVLRHNGAPYLRSDALDLNFLQYHSLDTMTFLYGGILLILVLFFKLIVKCIRQIIFVFKSNKLKKS